MCAEDYTAQQAVRMSPNEKTYCHTKSMSSVGTKDDSETAWVRIKVRNLRGSDHRQRKRSRIKLTRSTEVRSVAAPGHSAGLRKILRQATQAGKSYP